MGYPKDENEPHHDTAECGCGLPEEGLPLVVERLRRGLRSGALEVKVKPDDEGKTPAHLNTLVHDILDIWVGGECATRGCEATATERVEGFHESKGIIIMLHVCGNCARHLRKDIATAFVQLGPDKPRLPVWR